MSFSRLCIIFLFLNNICHAYETKAKQALLIDGTTNTILFEKNAYQKMHPSSMSKMMTVYIAFDYIKNNKLKLTDEFIHSKYAWQKEGSRTFIPINEKITVLELLRGIIVQSGNDAAATLAIGIAGNEDNFANLMNIYAKKIGLIDSNFVNSTGLPHENHYTTCYDLATLASRTIKDFPDLYYLYSEKEFTYNQIKQFNRNTLLFNYPGADGLKTGNTEIGGYSATISANRDGRRLIAVLNGLKSKAERSFEAINFLNYGFMSFSNISLAQKNKPLLSIDIIYGNENKVDLISLQDLYFTKNNLSNAKYKYIIEYKENLKAPITTEDQIAKLNIMENDVIVKSYPLYPNKNVSKSGFLKKIFQNFNYIFYK